MRLDWNVNDEQRYEFGLDRGVLYTENNLGIAWTGLVSVIENPVGGEAIAVFQDGVQYTSIQEREDFAATLEAYTYPDEFLDYDGSVSFGEGATLNEAPLKTFGLAYRTNIGDNGYKLHLVYNILANPSSSSYETLNRDSSAITFSWDLTTTPIYLGERQASAHFIVDTTQAHSWAIETLEDILYGTATSAPTLPTPEQLLTHFEESSVIRVIDNGDGTYSVSGPDPAVQFVDPVSFQLSWSTVNKLDEDTFTVSSL